MVVGQVGAPLDGHPTNWQIKNSNLVSFMGVALMGIGAFILALATKPRRRYVV